jgi:hypothetical protein
MNSINNYNNLLNNFVFGGGKGAGTLRTLSMLGVYICISILLMLEVLEPLTTQDAIRRLKDGSSDVLYGLFIAFSIVIPAIVFLSTYAFSYLDATQKAKRKTVFLTILTFFLVFHFSLTVAALVIGEAFLEEDDTNKRAKKRGFLYTKVIGIFIAMIANMFAVYSGK